jgi:hypothetical protein
MGIGNERTFYESIKSSQMDLILEIVQLLNWCDALQAQLDSTKAERGGLVESVQAKVNALREVQSPEGDASQSAMGEDLRRRRSLLPSVLDRAFKGEL